MSSTLAPDGVATARLPNGLHLQYRETGDRNGLPLILLHGVTDSLHSWKPFTDALPSCFRAIALTQRGHGDSSKPTGGYESAAFSADLSAFMDAIGVSRAHIVAHSMSTWIAQRFVREHPERVESLTLICGFVTLRGNASVAEVSDALQDMGDTIDPAFVHDFQVSTVATGLPPDFLKLVIAESLKVPAHIWRATFNAMTVERPDKTSIAHPALLISGGRDEFFDDMDRKRVAGVFRSPHAIFYEALGHAPHWEEPHLVAKDIARFVLEQNGKSQNTKAQASKDRIRPQGHAG